MTRTSGERYWLPPHEDGNGCLGVSTRPLTAQRAAPRQSLHGRWSRSSACAGCLGRPSSEISWMRDTRCECNTCHASTHLAPNPSAANATIRRSRARRASSRHSSLRVGYRRINQSRTFFCARLFSLDCCISCARAYCRTEYNIKSNIQSDQRFENAFPHKAREACHE